MWPVRRSAWHQRKLRMFGVTDQYFDSQKLEHIRRYLVEYFPLSSPEN